MEKGILHKIIQPGITIQPLRSCELYFGPYFNNLDEKKFKFFSSLFNQHNEFEMFEKHTIHRQIIKRKTCSVRRKK